MSNNTNIEFDYILWHDPNIDSAENEALYNAYLKDLRAAKFKNYEDVSTYLKQYSDHD